MYVRIEALLAEREMSAYELARTIAARGVVSEQAIYRLVRARGRLEHFNARVISELCEVLNVEPSELFAMGEPPAA